MFVVIRRFLIKKGHKEEMLARFTKGELPEGAISREVMINEIKINEDEIVLIGHWKDEESFRTWHKATHANKTSAHEKPEWIINVEVKTYKVI